MSAARTLALLLLIPAAARAEEPEPTTFRAMFYGAPGERPEMAEGPVVGFELREEPRRSLISHAAIMYLPGSMADLATTEYFRAKGGHEAMPIFRSRWVLIPYKLTVEPLAAAWMERWIERRGGRTLALVFRGVLWGSRALVAIHNYRYGKSL
jgi:hypothetical protein